MHFKVIAFARNRSDLDSMLYEFDENATELYEFDSPEDEAKGLGYNPMAQYDYYVVCDSMDVDDIEGPLAEPYAVVAPDGEWLDHGEFDLPEMIESLRGRGIRAYAIDMHI